MGGLGNNLFMLASVIGIAHRNNAIPCYNINEAHRISMLNTVDNKVKDLINIDIQKCPSIIHATQYEQGFAKFVPFVLQKSTMVGRYLQSYKYYVKMPVIKESARIFAKKYISFRSNSVTNIGIHVRRGDLLSYGYLRFPPEQYFKNAMHYFRDKYVNVQFFVSSDDIGWCKKQPYFEETHVISEKHTAVQDMSILASCDHVIISIGTFGWWSGMLSGGEVVYYENEFKMDHKINKGKVDTQDYYPPKWKKMNDMEEKTPQYHDCCRQTLNWKCSCRVAMNPSTCECTQHNILDTRMLLLREYPVEVARTSTPELLALVVWPHGMQYLEHILMMVRETPGVHVLRIEHRQVASMGAFINLIYEKEIATIPQYIYSKTAYLQALGPAPRVVIVTIGDVLPISAKYGIEQPYQFMANKNTVDLKWALRAAFNPRNHEGVSHDHVIYITDSTHDTLHLLKAIGGQPLSFEEYTRSHTHFYTPYWLPLPETYKRQLVALADLRIRCAASAGHCVAGSIIPIIKSPHFGFVQDTSGSGNDGNRGRDAYALYYERGATNGVLVDDHSVQAFKKLTKEFSVQRYGGCFSHPLTPSSTLRGLLLVKKMKTQSSTYVLVDGAHRAALLAAAGVRLLDVVVIGSNDADVNLPNTVSECEAGQRGNSVEDTVNLGLRALTYCGLNHTVLEPGTW